MFKTLFYDIKRRKMGKQKLIFFFKTHARKEREKVETRQES